tara:strand:+ start:3156 stop:3380 length:225 start_codon:yes stop_codon:yes gene_type:complete
MKNIFAGVAIIIFTIMTIVQLKGAAIIAGLIFDPDTLNFVYLKCFITILSFIASILISIGVYDVLCEQHENNEH